MAADDATAGPSLLVRLASHRTISILLPLAVIAIAVFVLRELARDVSWQDVKADLAATPVRRLLQAAAATALSFAAIGCYDLVGTHVLAPGQVPRRIALLTGFAGNAVSNLLGASYVTGSAVRYRAYSALGLEIPAIAGIQAMTWVGFWLGLILLLGGLLAFHPDGLSTVLPVDARLETAAGIFLLATLVALLAWLAGGRRLTLAGHMLTLPALRMSALLTAAGVGDLLGAALALYVLMPADLVPGFPYFFVVYIAAIALGILSHSPGGLGVFEATVIAGFGAAGRSDILAALLLYRLIYTGLPFLLATTGLAGVWAFGARDQLAGAASVAYRVSRSVVPPIAAGVCLVAGVVLLFSGSLPAETSRLAVIRDIVPLSVVEVSHLVASVVGMLLIIVSRGLYRRLYRAWLFAMILMAGGFAASLAKGLDWEEALSLLVAMAILGAFRSAFYRDEHGSPLRLSGPWVLSVVALAAAAIWIGLFAYSNVEYRNDLWWDFAWQGDASRYLRASLAVAILALAVLFNSALVYRPKPAAGRKPVPPEIRELVRRSEDAEAGLALMGDKEFLLAGDGSAFIAYADTGRTLISRGEPAGDPRAGRELVWQLRERADRQGRRCAFYAVSPAYVPTFLDMGLSILKIGEVARVRLDGFSLDIPAMRDFRQAWNRAGREGFEFAVIPAAELAPCLPRLREISDAWLATKHGAEKGFALGFFDEEYVSNFDHAVIRNAQSKEIFAFANLFQGANRHELSLDLMRYMPGGPKFAMDALFGQLMLWGAGEGFEWFSLGAAPFSGMENRQLASIWNRIGSFVYAHGEHFYNFEGLRDFKQKFDPVWTPNYLASQGGLAVPYVLYEINALISGGLKGLMR